MYEEKVHYFHTCSIFFQNALKEAGIENYLVIEIENMENCDDIQDYLQQLTGGRSVSKINLMSSGHFRNESKSLFLIEI